MLGDKWRQGVPQWPIHEDGARQGVEFHAPRRLDEKHSRYLSQVCRLHGERHRRRGSVAATYRPQFLTEQDVSCDLPTLHLLVYTLSSFVRRRVISVIT